MASAEYLPTRLETGALGGRPLSSMMLPSDEPEHQAVKIIAHPYPEIFHFSQVPAIRHFRDGLSSSISYSDIKTISDSILQCNACFPLSFLCSCPVHRCYLFGFLAVYVV